MLECDYSIGVTFILALFNILILAPLYNVSCHELSTFSVVLDMGQTVIRRFLITHLMYFLYFCFMSWSVDWFGLIQIQVTFWADRMARWENLDAKECHCHPLRRPYLFNLQFVFFKIQEMPFIQSLLQHICTRHSPFYVHYAFILCSKEAFSIIYISACTRVWRRE